MPRVGRPKTDLTSAFKSMAGYCLRNNRFKMRVLFRPRQIARIQPLTLVVRKFRGNRS